jgi:hypothetical protein
VQYFLANLNDKFHGLYNPNGRAIPDIAVQGRAFRVLDWDADISVSGTR